ncbi:hypothetical protein ACIQZG_23805 [Lysinibacillus sp. NPDC096418]|uniref:hypothetical protein n=1 Tax=Lysinibacillus sp. NPDC096418 TaxID=3364138 RepID=UPI0038276A7E
MKKLLIGSTLAVGLLFAGAGQSSAAIIGMGSVDLSSMDIETALQMVQQERVNLLESQLQGQLAEVQKKNEQIAIMNEELSKLNAQKLLLEIDKEATADEVKKNELEMQIGKISDEIVTLKNQIDSLSNSQQMEMLRLQSLSNKRNEAFDIMTNFINKMQDSRSSIINNMR